MMKKLLTEHSTIDYEVEAENQQWFFTAAPDLMDEEDR